MKKISVLTEEGSEYLLDDSKEDISEYSKKISQIFESSNVVILETTSGVMIVRPSKLVSVKITEHINEDPMEDPQKDTEDMVTD